MPTNAEVAAEAKGFREIYGCRFFIDELEQKISYTKGKTKLLNFDKFDDIYKETFGELFKATLDKANSKGKALNGEKMLNDFEMVISKYISRKSDEHYDTKHKPYAGMQRGERLDFIERLASEVPSNFVDSCVDLYKKGEINANEMRESAKSILSDPNVNSAKLARIAGYVEALKKIDKKRGFFAKIGEFFRGRPDQKAINYMKQALTKKLEGGNLTYENCVSAAYNKFDGHRSVEENIAVSRASLSISEGVANRARVSAKEHFAIHELKEEKASTLKSGRVRSRTVAPTSNKHKGKQ